MSAEAALMLMQSMSMIFLLSNEVGETGEKGEKGAAVCLVCGMIRTSVVILLGLLAGRKQGKTRISVWNDY
jgi:hypothetical protein